MGRGKVPASIHRYIVALDIVRVVCTSLHFINVGTLLLISFPFNKHVIKKRIAESDIGKSHSRIRFQTP